MSSITISQITPEAGVRGGQIAITCQGLDTQTLASTQLLFGTQPTRPSLITPRMLLGAVPAGADASSLQITQGALHSEAVPFRVATVVAENLHPLTNPVVDRRGAIYTTVSGSKGQQVPVSLYRIPPFGGEAEPFASGLVNPTGIALSPDETLYVSCRHEGVVYRVSQDGTATAVANQLGIATGMAFDTDGVLYVGDSRGAIQQVASNGTVRLFARLEPSSSSYHLAFGDDGWLYVSYPTMSGIDQIYRLSPQGEVQSFVQGLGRAQGLAFDRARNLYVVAYIDGKGGVVRITPEGEQQRVIAGVNLVGLAFGMHDALFLVDQSTLYSLPFGVEGRLLP